MGQQTEIPVDKIEVKDATNVIMHPSEKERKKSASYALKAFSTHLKTLKENGLISKEDEQMAEEIKNKAVEKWFKSQF